MNPTHQNYAALIRIKEVYKKKSKWLLEPGRIVDKAWSVQTSLVDNIIILGNYRVVDSYQKYFSRKIYNIPISYYKIFGYEEILKNKNFGDVKKHFLWFGSSELIHKGLDLLLEVFKELPDLHLHICGPIDSEPKFKNSYYEELYNTKIYILMAIKIYDLSLLKILLVNALLLFFLLVHKEGLALLLM